MVEVELKAWVHDRNAVLKRLNDFAEFSQSVIRNDTYYHIPAKSKSDSERNYISVRLRKETVTECGAQKSVSKTLLTYKQKELLYAKNGTATEVNDEKETEVQDSLPLEALFLDLGGKIALKKHKDVTDYTAKTSAGKATLELCAVENLGDFLEIEILTEDNSEQNVTKIREELLCLLQKCGLSQKDIEPRYYSQLLAESSCTKTKST